MVLKKISNFDKLDIELDRQLQDIVHHISVPFKNKVAKVTDYVIAFGEEFIEGDTTNNTIAFTLPNVSDSKDMMITFKDSGGNANTNNITLSCAESDCTIDGSATYVISVDYGKITIYSTGSKWLSV